MFVKPHFFSTLLSCRTKPAVGLSHVKCLKPPPRLIFTKGVVCLFFLHWHHYMLWHLPPPNVILPLERLQPCHCPAGNPRYAAESKNVTGWRWKKHKNYPPWKLRWQWNIHHLKVYLLLKMVIFHDFFQCHVGFQGCISREDFFFLCKHIAEIRWKWCPWPSTGHRPIGRSRKCCRCLSWKKWDQWMHCHGCHRYIWAFLLLLVNLGSCLTDSQRIVTVGKGPFVNINRLFINCCRVLATPRLSYLDGMPLNDK